ncbi:MAG: cobalt transporter [Thermoplasmata archaeon]
MKIDAHLKAVIGVIVIFAIGAIGYWVFSSELPDGLERTMEEAGVEEQPPVYQAPLSYGEDYASYVLMGLIGFVSVLLVSLAIGKLMAKRNGA